MRKLQVLQDTYDNQHLFTEIHFKLTFNIPPKIILMDLSKSSELLAETSIHLESLTPTFETAKVIKNLQDKLIERERLNKVNNQYIEELITQHKDELIEVQKQITLLLLSNNFWKNLDIELITNHIKDNNMFDVKDENSSLNSLARTLIINL
jgi:phosphoenolpyruvate carboxylase